MVLLDHIQALEAEKHAQKLFSSWLKIKNQTAKFLCYLVNHQKMSHNIVQLHFRGAPRRYVKAHM